MSSSLTTVALAERKRRFTRFYWPPVLWSAAAGGVGGMLGWAAGESLNTSTGSAQIVTLYLNEFAYFFVISALIGAALGALPGLLNRSRRQVVRGALLAVVVGGIVGGLGALPAQFIYNALGNGLIARGAGWAIVGAAIGLCPGIATRDARRTLRGILGGAIGGFLGGLLFNAIGYLIPAGAGDTGTANRFIADLVVGATVGAMVAVVEAALRNAWLMVLSGRREGAQFILSKQMTAIGRDDRDDVILWGDPLMEARHAAIRRSRRGYVLERLDSSAPTLVNGVPATGPTMLRDGDELQLGSTRFQFHTRGAATAALGAQGASPGTVAVQPAPGRPPGSAGFQPAPGRPPGSAGFQPAPGAGIGEPCLPGTAGFQPAPAGRQQQYGSSTPLPAAADPARPAVHGESACNGLPPAGPQGATPGTGGTPKLTGRGTGKMPAVPGTDARLAADSAARQAVAARPTFRLVGSAGHIIDLPERAVLRVGRTPDNDVVIADAAVSARHAELRWDGAHWLVVDLGSTNGTFVRDPDSPAQEQRIEHHTLRDGATVRFGQVVYRVECATY